MDSAMPKICLNMIVKNEAHVIRRALDSVLPIIDTWCILDTGSTDGTQDLIREHLKDLPGELHEAPWKGFGASRTEAIELARTRADYLLFIDADDELLLPKGFKLPALRADAYLLQHRLDNLTFMRMDLVATRCPWRYAGVLHEYLESDGPRPADLLAGPVILERREGARSLDPRKYERDAEVLEQALLEEPGNARYVFYLAQSRKDASQQDAALEAYRRRVAMGGWEEEVYVSLLRVAQLLEQLERPEGEVAQAYLEAYQFRPQRRESLVGLAACYRKRQKYHLALLFAEKGLKIPRPGDILFVEEDCYTWRCLDEFAVSSSWLGRHRDALQACDRLLTEGLLPPAEVKRVKANRDLSAKAVPGAPPLRLEKVAKRR
jgi:glycosyltransferase involved in cell wall biosynthesis